MEEVVIEEQDSRYVYSGLPHGVPETQPLDFHSPYGCSKGSGDQYTRDYHRIYDLPTVVFRQSCIYGPRQFGVEDQGWVAWFIIAVAKGWPIKIYGDGKQVRDLLYVSDLLDAYDLALAQIEKTAGQVYNLGGGPHASISVWHEFGPLLERIYGRKLPVEWGDWRPGDQKVYVSNIHKAKKDLGWAPQVGVEAGVERLAAWVKENLDLF
jgi:CDP-paratose 2-epimerase